MPDFKSQYLVDGCLVVDPELKGAQARVRDPFVDDRIRILPGQPPESLAIGIDQRRARLRPRPLEACRPRVKRLRVDGKRRLTRSSKLRRHGPILKVVRPVVLRLNLKRRRRRRSTLQDAQQHAHRKNQQEINVQGFAHRLYLSSHAIVLISPSSEKPPDSRITMPRDGHLQNP